MRNGSTVAPLVRTSPSPLRGEERIKNIRFPVSTGSASGRCAAAPLYPRLHSVAPVGGSLADRSHGGYYQSPPFEGWPRGARLKRTGRDEKVLCCAKPEIT